MLWCLTPLSPQIIEPKKTMTYVDGTGLEQTNKCGGDELVIGIQNFPY